MITEWSVFPFNLQEHDSLTCNSIQAITVRGKEQKKTWAFQNSVIEPSHNSNFQYHALANQDIVKD